MRTTIAVTPGLFHAGEEGARHLIGGHCASCDRFHFPATRFCPYCSAHGCEPRPLTRTGTLYLYTTVVNRPPGYRGEVPFGFGVVELPEGLRVVTLLTETNPERLRPGLEMRLVFQPLYVDEEGRQVITYAFAPAHQSQARGGAADVD